jgi:hypothetical protein
MIICPLSVAPRGCFRVIGVDLVEDERYLVGDYSDKTEALAKVSTHNDHRRKKYWSRDDIYFVYDDKGRSVHE